MTYSYLTPEDKVISFAEITNEGWGFSVFEKLEDRAKYLESGEGFATLEAAKVSAVVKFGELRTF